MNLLPAVIQSKIQRLPVRLGDHRAERQVRHMAVGESCWAPPWCLSVDPEGRCWIDPALPAELHAPSGTCVMKITRLADGVRVELHDRERRETYRAEKIREGYLPVVELAE